IPLTKQFNTMDPVSAEIFHHGTGDLFGTLQRQIIHRLRLPGFAIVTIFLPVTDRITEGDTLFMPHRQQGDLIIKVDKAFDDYPALSGPASGLRVLPRSFNTGFGLYCTLALPDELITGFTTRGSPTSATACRYSSRVPANRYGD